MGGSKDCPQSCGQRKEILGGRITQTCMEVLIRDEWIRLERASGIIATTSGTVAIVKESSGQVTTDDGTYSGRTKYSALASKLSKLLGE
jgi:hypothetical protein